MSDDDWDVDLDTVNNLTSEESRWGGNVGGVINDTESMTQLREKVLTSDEQKRAQKGYQSSYGYGGKFGVEKDRMDKSALDATYKAEVAKHSSVVDNKVGFGGKFGVQRDRQDKSAADWSHKEQVDKHVSQRDYKTGFGGKFGVQKDRKDASAHGWERDPESASSAKPVAPAKPNFMAGVSVGNMKSKFEKPKSEDTTESVAKYRAARAEQERREREAQQQPTGTDAQQSPKSQVGSKQPNRAEEARQLVAQSKVSSAASQFNATPAPTPPMPQSQSKPLPPKANANVSSVSARFAEAAKKEEEEREKERQREREKRAEEAKMREQQMQQQQQKDEEEENERTMREQVKRDLEARDKERLIVEQQREAEESRVTDSGRGDGVNVVRTEGSVPGYGGIAEGVQTAGAHTVLTGEGRGMCATALFDYAANGDDELSFWAGDVITNIDTSLDEGWWMGSCNGISGLFPRNFVAVDESTSSVSHAQMPINVTPMVGRESDLANDNIYFDPSSATDPVEEASLDLSKLPQAVALYDFNSDDPQDLKFEPDETISVQNLENPDWWFGFIGPNRQGYFPANHVELLS